MPQRTDVRLLFQRRLKQARLVQELSQRDLGIKAGLDPFVASTRVNRYEKGIHEPDMATVARLAAALKVPPAYLFAEDERLARMILAFEQLSSTEKDQFLRSVENAC
jgi:transcriptional regulator with XRE-family HTH domain